MKKIRYRFVADFPWESAKGWQEMKGRTLASALKSIAEHWSLIGDSREVEVEGHGRWLVGGKTRYEYYAVEVA